MALRIRLLTSAELNGSSITPWTFSNKIGDMRDYPDRSLQIGGGQNSLFPTFPKMPLDPPLGKIVLNIMRENEL